MTINRYLLTLFIALALGCAGAQKKEQTKEDKADFHYKMAAGYFESHEIPLAIKEATAVFEIDPTHRDTHYLLGFIYQGRRDYPKAIDHYQQVLKADPKYHFARNNLGTVYLLLERWDDAALEFEQLIEEPLYPTPELAHNNLGWALYQRRKYNRALDHFKMATFLKPQMCLAHNNTGLVYQKLGNHNEAMHEFREAVRLCPNQYAEPHFHIGKMLAETGNPEALQHFQKCADLEPGSHLGRRCREYLAVRP
jgi:Tfp pilus assembly protein PilF